MSQIVTVNGVQCIEITEGVHAGVYGPGFQVGVTKPGHCGHAYLNGACPYCWPVAPTITPVAGPGGEQETVERHPAYALIRASRVSGTGRLAGSDFIHHHYMTIEISEAQIDRHLHNDWWHPRRELIQVALSEAQWATFVSSPNAGVGVPCTLERRESGAVPRLPAPKARTAQFSAELDQKLAGVRERVARLKKLVEEGGGKKAMRDELRQLAMALDSNLDFVASQFGEHMEATVEKAKVEIHAYMNAAVQAAGLHAMGGVTPPLALPGETKEDGK